MLDLQFIYDHLEEVEDNCRWRGVKVDLRGFRDLRDRRNATLSRLEQLRHQQKEVSQRIPQADSSQRPGLIDQGRQLREQISALEQEYKELEEQLRRLQASVPNMTHPDAPRGRDEKDNRVVRQWGNIPEFSFPPRDHVALCEKHQLLDLEAGARVAGHGFYFLKNEAVLLELALMQYALQILRRRGWMIHSTPDVARREVLEGTGYQPRGPESQIYSLADSDLCLVATAEITLGGTLRDRILEIDELPLRYGGISHCFRTEAGAHGKATRGIYRVHQFTKVEMFAFTAPSLEASDALHREIVEIEEEIFQGLEIPYRVVDICTGDLGGPAYRKFDLEAWMPGRGEYGEITSASNCTDFQARRLGIRCRLPDKRGTAFVHTLNGTAVAITRAIIALLENHQQADGSIRIPAVLRPWMGIESIG
ncbi:MAG: serine--tRNA ligase [Planctomycetaceae bacterium]|nr:MAG: serine--tRNA ligase [Planctomycetaceae bacterium]